MKKLNSNHLILIILFLLLVFFDTMQQRYYLEQFSLSNDEIIFSSLFFSHGLRWIILLLVAIPASFLIQNLNDQNKDSYRKYAYVFLIVIITIIIAILLISLFSMFVSNNGNGKFMEYVAFFFYQKAAVFLLGLGLVLFFLDRLNQERVITGQWAEIEILNQTNNNLVDALKNEEPSFDVKVNGFVHHLALKDIIWIEADDYCSRIHTEEKFYIIRKSLKSFEIDLSLYNFLRVHRSALINTNHQRSFSARKLTVSLSNGIEIRLSKKGLAKLNGQKSVLT